MLLGYPTNIAGAIVNVYIATDSLATSTPEFDALIAKHIKHVHDGLDKALLEYGAFAEALPNITLILSPDVPTTNSNPTNANSIAIT